ncbi:Protein of unknown function DUF473 [Ferroglobus placidus DSM 10642]|uniref:DUF473 domain-containing protein n=2 Tax=Ferroglobus placidus TaxID=54261 RepID=D3RXD4_FERPA|nr:Protein of unknown function DUF473 [Ferroglobus placidus DSM 10642]
MRCWILTGISRRVIDDIISGYTRTIELRSAHNVSIAMKAEVGDCVLLTPARFYELDRGIVGLIAEVVGKEVHSHSIVFAKEGFVEESEMTAVRLKLKPRGIGRVVAVKKKELLGEVEGEVVQIEYFSAR